MKRFLSVVPMCLALDFATKYWAQTYLQYMPEGKMEFILRVLEFRYAQNTGAAFSAFSNNSLFILILTAALILAVLFFIVFCKEISGSVKTPLWIVFAGGVGNFINRLIYGYVIDFINPLFVRFAIFNFADICITVGAAVAVLLYIFTHKNAAKGT